MTDRDPECLFCRIAAGEIPSDRVHEDDDVIAFRDIAPRAPTHVLVIPRRHIADAHALTDDDAELLAKLFAVVRRVADAEGLERGYRVVTNVGPESGQTVFHLHLHLLGGRPMAWPPG
ncbi:MAG: histidine triad nucleotide-binding protein [Chloroflexi bacterium]|nr:histidine triad nucleotide-binding protein [Chloroflexota bacterium]